MRPTYQMLGFLMLLLLAAASPSVFAQSTAGAAAPTPEEIVRAYRSSGDGVRTGPIQIGRRKSPDVRGWGLTFKRISQTGGPIASTAKYRVVARQAGSCASYLLTDMVPLTDYRIKPVLTAEPLGGITACQ